MPALTVKQAHHQAKLLFRQARKLRDRAIETRAAMATVHDNLSGLPRIASQCEALAELTLELTTDLMIESADVLLKDVPK